MMANRFSNLIGTEFRFGDIFVGVSLPFDVPSLQLPTAIFSFSYGLIKILVLLGKATKMVLSKLNDAKSKIAQIVPEGQVQAQTDDNAAVKGAPTVTIEVNAQAMAEEKMKEKLQEKIDEKKDEAMEKLDKKLEEKMTKKKTEDEETAGEETI